MQVRKCRDLNRQHADQVGAADTMLGARGHDDHVSRFDVIEFFGSTYREIQLGSVIAALFAE